MFPVGFYNAQRMFTKNKMTLSNIYTPFTCLGNEVLIPMLGKAIYNIETKYQSTWIKIFLEL